MDSSLSSIEYLVSEVRKEIFSDNIIDTKIHTFVSPSAYDTAWLAMIPDPQNQGPMFKNCLNWVLENQKEGGFWGETYEDGIPAIDALPATLVCMAALNTWNEGTHNIAKGLTFIQSMAVEEILVRVLQHQNLPRWFILVFPATIELAEAAGLELVFPTGLREGLIADILFKRRQIVEMENLAEEKSELYYPPLLAYLETLPTNYDLNEQEIVNRLSCDGSLFQSPSATARAFVATNNINCIKYLQYVVEKFPNGGVPAKYPMDEDLIKLVLVDHIQRLGLADYFNREIEQILAQIYSSNRKETLCMEESLPMKIFKEALAFRLLRMHGHHVNPGSFCWFLKDAEIMGYMQENCEQFISAMYSVYRATDLLFPEESELEEAQSFARNMLQHYCMIENGDHNLGITVGLQKVIKHELNVPWTARLDHLNHRLWIEETKISPLWIGKASLYRFSCLDNKKLAQLAVENFEFRQSIYRQELKELKGWSVEWGLAEMGFGREKTEYLYFAVASCSCHPFYSIWRLVVAKAAIIVTVADDFYDMEGSESELQLLTTAVQRWNGEELTGHSKTIFNVLESFVTEYATTFPSHERSKFVENMQNLWSETFKSWMVEKTWSLTGYIPTMDEYLKNAMISIAAHTIALPTTTNFSNENLNFEYHSITKLLMTISRLLNDTQSYQKEEEEGKMNFVHLHMKENPHPDASLEDSIAYANEILKVKRKEFLKRVFTYDDNMPKSCKRFHLSCMIVFHMFFNSANLFDSETALHDTIQKAIYLPIHREPEPEPEPEPQPELELERKIQIDPLIKLPTYASNKEVSKISARFRPIMNRPSGTSLIKQPYFKNMSSFISSKRLLHMNMKFNMSFI